MLGRRFVERCEYVISLHLVRGTFHFVMRLLMRSYTVVVERDAVTGLYIGSVPGWPGAHSQAETLDELTDNMREVLAMLLEDGEPDRESEFIRIQLLGVP